MNKLLIAILVLAGPIAAEMNHDGNPAFADRMESLRLNPALAAWQPLAFSMDWEVLHAGLLDSPTALSQAGFHFTIPRYNLVVLVDHRDTDLQTETELCFDWAWRPRGNFSLGLEAGLRHFGWNRDRLGDDILQDPVFADGTDRWQPLLGVGAFWSPWVGVQTALSLKRVNRPGLALQDDDSRAPVRLFSGIVWRGDQLRLGLSLDNLRYVNDGEGWADALSSNLQGALQVGWRALDQLEMMADLRSDAIAFDAGLALSGGHEVGYEWVMPLGDLAEHSRGSHHLRYRYSLGGALAPAGQAPDAPQALPADRWRGGDLVELFGRRWAPARTPVRLRSMSPQLELLELHVHVDEELAYMLRDSNVSLEDLALSGLYQGGNRVEPRESGVVRETYSPAWWRLSGWLEELAWDAGVSPVVHVGERSGRVEDLANLLGAPLEERGAGAVTLPDGKHLLLPDTLRMECSLEPELADQAGSWELQLELPAGGMLSRTGRGAPPELIELPLGAPDVGFGHARLTFLVDDESGRRMILREMELPVVQRVRHVHLRQKLDGDPEPGDVDGIHLHLKD